MPDEDGLVGNNLQLLFPAAVAERHGTADPDALAFGGGDLVADAFADDFSLELRE
ncbi:MAG: hypothetical protein V9G24_02305 [Rhodoblastus sp.]